MDYIFVDREDDRDIIGIVEEGRLVEIYTEKRDEDFSIGNIYRGRVENVVAGIDSAFVDIGHFKNGYLFVKDALALDKLYSEENLAIGDVLKNGEDIIVQISKEGKGNKGPRLTRHITIPGSYIVLTPFSNRINISRKIDKSKAKNLREFGRTIQINDIGFVIRTNGGEARMEDIEREYRSLVSLYEKILREKNFLPCPKLIYRDMDFLYKLINDGNYRNYKVLVNNKELYSSLGELDKTVLYNIKDRLILDRDFDLMRDSKLSEDLNKGLRRKLELIGGSSIIIDKTEAMTVIDVNSAGYTSGGDLNETIWATNVAAAREIARQIRLRNITGIIIVDFIDFRDREMEEEFLAEFNKELLQDPNKANIIGMTRLGLVELTRKKTRVSDIEYFIDRCTGNNRPLNL